MTELRDSAHDDDAGPGTSSSAEWPAGDLPSTSRTSSSGGTLGSDIGQPNHPKLNLGSFPLSNHVSLHNRHHDSNSSPRHYLSSLTSDTSGLPVSSRGTSAEYYSPKESSGSLPLQQTSPLPPIPETARQTTGYAGYDEPFVTSDGATSPQGKGQSDSMTNPELADESQYTRDMLLSWQSQRSKDGQGYSLHPTYYNPTSARPDVSSYIDEHGHYIASNGHRQQTQSYYHSRQPSLPPYPSLKALGLDPSEQEYLSQLSPHAGSQRPPLPHHASFPSYNPPFSAYSQHSNSHLNYANVGDYPEMPRPDPRAPEVARQPLHLDQLPPAPSWLINAEHGQHLQNESGTADPVSPSVPMQMNSVANAIGGITPDLLTPGSNGSYFPEASPIAPYPATLPYFEFHHPSASHPGSYSRGYPHQLPPSLDTYTSPAVTIASLPSPALFAHHSHNDYQAQQPHYSTTPGGVPEGRDYFHFYGSADSSNHHADGSYGNGQHGRLGASGMPSSPSFGPAFQSSYGSGMVGGSGSGKTKNKRENRRLEGFCEACKRIFASIYLRGQDGDFDVGFKLSYICVHCAESQPDLQASRKPPLAKIEAAVTAATTSAEDSPVAPASGETPSKPPSSASSAKVKEKTSKKRARASDLTSPAVCDVCSRVVGYGAAIATDGKSDLTFNIEIVCGRCETRYARCSDCGGGGGARLGVGKWRCKELFSPGRRTCDLSHARQSNIASMQYHVVKVSEIPPSEKAEIVETCQKVFECSLYSSLAVPEVLERGTAMASTYEDVVDRVRTGWAESRTCIEDDVEATDGYRRYLGLRWAAPKPRKTASKKNGDSSSNTADQETEDGSVLRPGKNLSGYITAEWDIKRGTFFITVSVPYSTGEQYEGAAHLISMMTARAVREREDMVRTLESQRRTAEAKSIPPIQHTYTMLFFSRDSKLLTYLESKRQLIPLDRYLEKYPDVDPRIFPPHRKCYLTPERQKGWTVLVRRIGPKTSHPNAMQAAATN